ncbi:MULTISPECIES: hypothetical protein [Paenibacillus]|uniref:hypothetical protein n=1 Tax=Paenibacillus TaxID=44249 RepID=UPI0022B93CD2|nr:hypothetical protein [Paenibacillus caseinilyticus]MCZ8521104.1 hypothetical protein [Paenibacillus caseinilyticus]
MVYSSQCGDKDFSARFDKRGGPGMSAGKCLFHFFMVVFLLLATVGFGAFFVSYAGILGVLPTLIPASALLAFVVSWIRSY